MTDEYYSPLRYPGGKAKVADYFKHVIRENLLLDGVYVEPFAGGASVALSLLLNEYVSRIIINDIDRAIYAFWHCVLNETDKICALIQNVPINIKHWREQRDIQKNKKDQDLLSLGFSTFYLNRTNRSGILSGGVIGGLDQKGPWKMNARYNKARLIRRIQRISEYRTRIELYNCDALKLITHLKLKLPKNTLFYLDPPYFEKGQDLYLNYYRTDDHQKIASAVEQIKKQKWIVTYDNVTPIRQMYRNYRKIKFSLNYSAAKAVKGEEIIIFSKDLYLKRSRSIYASQ